MLNVLNYLLLFKIKNDNLKVNISKNGFTIPNIIIKPSIFQINEFLVIECM
jgi:hypothetical protein